MLAAVLSLGLIGMIAAVALGLAAKKFAVEVDPRELAVLEALPGANCGACGFPGCAGYAKALVAGTVDGPHQMNRPLQGHTPGNPEQGLSHFELKVRTVKQELDRLFPGVRRRRKNSLDLRACRLRALL